MPMMRRRPLLRAAAVGGGAYAMGKRNARVQGEQQDQAYEQGMQAAAPAPVAPPPAAPAAGGMTAEVTTRLGELGKLHEQGVLTDAEFSEAKAKLLGL
jgi:Short C-terminal domain